MPIKARIDMLATGIRTPVGIKVLGRGLGEMEKVARDIVPDRGALARGPTSIRTENGQLALYIFVDMHDRDLGGYVADAQKAVADNVRFPPGTYVQ